MSPPLLTIGDGSILVHRVVKLTISAWSSQQEAFVVGVAAL